MLSRMEPPPEGPTADMVDRYVDHPSPVKAVLRNMLDTNADSRPRGGADLLSALDVTRSHEKLPQHLLILTRSAIRDLRTAGHYRGDRFQNSADALVEDLGGKEVDEVYINRDQQDNRGVVLLGDSLRLICTRNQKDDALVVKAIQTPYGPHLDREKGRSMPYRAVWIPVDAESTGGRPPGATARALRELWITMKDYQRLEVASKERRRSRQEFIEHWNIALRDTRSRIEKGTPALRYTSVVEESDYFRFSLMESPPDDLGWDDDMRLAVKDSPEARMIPVGNLIGIRGTVVRVAKETRLAMGSGSGDSSIPRHGLLTVNVAEALTAYTRQQHAVHAFLNGEMVNQNVANCIIDPAAATRMTEPDVEYFQEWLSDDKKGAVRMALSCGELSLIKGPPGTGKTSVIAEVVLQILKHDPEARILLTSQSNVAVDHALAQIAKASIGDPPAMVRYGRPEKIGDAGKNWTLRRRVRSWRKDVVKRCDAIVDELREAERSARASVKEVKAGDVGEAENAEMMQEWVTEAKSLAEQLADYRQELTALGTDASKEIRATVEAAVAGTREELRGQLTALSDLLQEEDGGPMADETEEKALAKIVKKVAEATTPEVSAVGPEERELRRIRELRATVTQWRKVAGLGSDFEELVAKSARVVAATCSMSGKRKGATVDNSFDWAIVDEAGRATVPEVLIPMVQSERTILVGDERQLPPTLDETLRESGPASGDWELDRSLFQSMIGQMDEGRGLATLRTQYRMHPAIGSLISTVFYDGTLENGDSPERRGRMGDWMPAVVTWLSTSSLPNRAEVRRGASYENVAEVDVVATVLTRLESRVELAREKTVVVGVIAGYSAQVERLVTRIDPDNDEIWQKLRIEVATVDAFQGRECDVVIYSTVRSNRDRRIGFLRDYRRVNVALSRARELLVIVGDDRMMESASVVGSDNPFTAVLSYMKSAKKECAVVPAGVAGL